MRSTFPASPLGENSNGPPSAVPCVASPSYREASAPHTAAYPRQIYADALVSLVQQIRTSWRFGSISLLLLFLTSSALVANPEKLLYTVANPARGLLNRVKKKKRKSRAVHPSELLVRRK